MKTSSCSVGAVLSEPPRWFPTWACAAGPVLLPGQFPDEDKTESWAPPAPPGWTPEDKSQGCTSPARPAGTGWPWAAKLWRP